MTTAQLYSFLVFADAATNRKSGKAETGKTPYSSASFSLLPFYSHQRYAHYFKAVVSDNKTFVKACVFTAVCLCVMLYFYFFVIRRRRPSSGRGNRRGGGENGRTSFTPSQDSGRAGDAFFSEPMETSDSATRRFLSQNHLLNGSDCATPIGNGSSLHADVHIDRRCTSFSDPRRTITVSIALNNTVFSFVEADDDVPTQADRVPGEKLPDDNKKRRRKCVVCADDVDVQAFRDMCRLAEVYVLTQVNSDEDEELVREMLRDIGVVGDCLIKPHRVLFSSTVEGRVAMVRQLQPSTHIDGDVSIMQSLAGKVPNVVTIATDPASRSISRRRAENTQLNKNADAAPIQTLKCFVDLLKEVRPS